MLNNPFKSLTDEKRWGGVVVFAAFLIVTGLWLTFKDLLVKGNADEKYWRMKFDSLSANCQQEKMIVIRDANVRIDRANARTDSVIRVQVQEKTELIALFTEKFGPVQRLSETDRQKTRNLEKKLEKAGSVVREIKDAAINQKPQ